jgi:hypothetical protein
MAGRLEKIGQGAAAFEPMKQVIDFREGETHPAQDTFRFRMEVMTRRRSGVS